MTKPQALEVAARHAGEAITALLQAGYTVGEATEKLQSIILTLMWKGEGLITWWFCG